MREEEWRYRQQGEGGKSEMEHKKEPGEGQGGHTKGKGVAPFTNNNGQVVGKGKDPRIGIPIIIAREVRNRWRNQRRGIMGGKQNQKRRPGKEPQKGQVKSVERVAEENIDGRGAPETPEMVEGEGVCNQT